MARKSTAGSRRRKAKSTSIRPAKVKGSPLYAHPAGYWACKIDGKFEYFHRWGKIKDGKMVLLEGDTHQAALDEYNRHIEKGDKKGEDDRLTVKDLCNHFLTWKQGQVQSRELTTRSFIDYNRTTDRLIRVLGKHKVVAKLTPTDFAKLRDNIAKTRKLQAMKNEITRVRSVFKFAFADGLIDRPVQYGVRFAPPKAENIEKAKNENGPIDFAPEEIRALLDAAGPQLKAFILLGINGGMGPHDIGMLPVRALQEGWLNFPRQKTGKPRRFKLWQETERAIAAARKAQPAPKPGHDKCLFLTRKGHCWANEKDNAGTISREFTKLLRKLDLYRHGRGFYSLRRTFQTIGEEAGETATSFIMGHARKPSDMSAIYRQRIRDERLQAVTDYVHEWLFPPKKKRGRG